MKYNILIIICLALIGYGTTLYLDQGRSIPTIPEERAAQQVSPQQTTPDFTFTDIQGRSANLHDFKGKTILLNFWASWCAPCIKEFPALIQASQDFKDNVVLIALSSDMDQEKMQAFLKRLKTQNTLQYEYDNVYIAHDREGVTQNLFQTYKLPETLLIGPDLSIKTKYIGANWTKEEMQETLSILQN